MNRRWNIPLWLGFLIVLCALLAYPLVFARFPVTRDHPWVTLLMSGAGFLLMALGLSRAYREPQHYRGKALGTILAFLGVTLVALFAAGIFYFSRQLPLSKRAPHVGEKAPDFTLPDQDGNLVTLSKLLESGRSGAERPSGVVLIFYRGYW